MAEECVIELSLLLDHNMFEQFSNYDVPSVISPEFILVRTSKAFARSFKDQSHSKLTADAFKTLDSLLKKIAEKSIPRFKIEKFITLFESLIYCMERSRPEERSIAFSNFNQLLSLFDSTGRCLLIRELFKRVSNGTIKVQYEPQILAFFIDSYRRCLKVDETESKTFHDELTYFYTDISKVNYREVELCFQYFIAVALLVQFQATIGFNKDLLKAAKTKVLEPIFTQVSDFRTLENFKDDNEPKFEHLEFLLFSLDNSRRIINNVLCG